jgi:hypothetical protein
MGFHRVTGLRIMSKHQGRHYSLLLAPDHALHDALPLCHIGVVPGVDDHVIPHPAII